MATKLNESKREIIGQLIEEYKIKDGKDLQEALKDLLGGTIQEMLESELEEELGYTKSERTTRPKENYRNGYKPKSVKTSMAGEIELSIPQERKGEFEPVIVPKHSRDISGIEQKIIAMYGRGLTTREISEQIEDIYGFEASAEMVSKVTDKILPQIEEWQQRSLSEVYPIVFIDAIMFNVRKERLVSKKAVYVVLGINSEGMKEVLSIEIGDVESSKYWLGVLNNLKNRGVRDILMLCADGLTGIKEAIEAAFPMTEYQHCIVHMVRNTLKHVSHKHKKDFLTERSSVFRPEEHISCARRGNRLR
jgi:transposase-like protein